MGREGRRLRGLVMRAILHRRVAVVVGSVLAAPAAWLLAADYRWETWYTDAIGLICGATGAALLLAGLGGRRPDWIEPEE